MTQTSNQEVLEKAIIKAILRTGRLLVYRQELEGIEYTEVSDYVFRYNENDSGFDILTHPDLLKLDEREIEIFSEIYTIAEDMDINQLSDLITKYVVRKQQTCTKTGHVWFAVLQKARNYFDVETDDSEYNYNTYSGKTIYKIKEDGSTLGMITEDVDYCNYCISDPSITIGVQKCVKYYLQEEDEQ